MPTSFEWERYAAWAKEFNTDILHLDVGGQSIIVLDTYEACTELLDKRSKYYSTRPSFTMAVDLVGFDFNIGFIPYGARQMAGSSPPHKYMADCTEQLLNVSNLSSSRPRIPSSVLCYCMRQRTMSRLSSAIWPA